MGRLARRALIVAFGLAAPACSTYGRDETTYVQVHDDASPDGPGGGDDTGDAFVPPTEGGADAADADTSDGSIDGTGLVFVSSTTTLGFTLTSVAHANAMCATLAEDAHIRGTFRAWLSDGISHPSADFTGNGPWHLMDGTPVASSRSQLLSGVLTHAIDRDENGNVLGGAATVWTGTATNGTPSGNDCGGWNNIGTTGSTGKATAIDALWTNAGTAPCNTMLAIYCFAQ